MHEINVNTYDARISERRHASMSCIMKVKKALNYVRTVRLEARASSHTYKIGLEHTDT